MKNTCSKCGDMFQSPQYDNAIDELVYRCSRCGYKWTQLPLDRRWEQGDSTPPEVQEMKEGNL